MAENTPGRANATVQNIAKQTIKIQLKKAAVSAMGNPQNAEIIHNEMAKRTIRMSAPKRQGMIPNIVPLAVPPQNTVVHKARATGVVPPDVAARAIQHIARKTGAQTEAAQAAVQQTETAMGAVNASTVPQKVFDAENTPRTAATPVQTIAKRTIKMQLRKSTVSANPQTPDVALKTPMQTEEAPAAAVQQTETAMGNPAPAVGAGVNASTVPQKVFDAENTPRTAATPVQNIAKRTIKMQLRKATVSAAGSPQAASNTQAPTVALQAEETPAAAVQQTAAPAVGADVNASVPQKVFDAGNTPSAAATPVQNIAKQTLKMQLRKAKGAAAENLQNTEAVPTAAAPTIALKMPKPAEAAPTAAAPTIALKVPKPAEAAPTAAAPTIALKTPGAEPTAQAESAPTIALKTPDNNQAPPTIKLRIPSSSAPDSAHEAAAQISDTAEEASAKEQDEVEKTETSEEVQVEVNAADGSNEPKLWYTITSIAALLFILVSAYFMFAQYSNHWMDKFKLPAVNIGITKVK